MREREMGWGERERDGVGRERMEEKESERWGKREGRGGRESEKKRRR